MTDLAFRAPEYRQDGTFAFTDFAFRGSEAKGWEVFREGRPFLELGPGYTPVRSLFCGVCSTDLARRFLPFPLPQVIGHEVVGLARDRPVVVEINASHKARGFQVASCPFCSRGLDTQCPERITLGINTLPGGFAPYFLAPGAAILDLPEGVNPVQAALTEPLAAALQALEVTAPRDGERVAVLGPRRLGSLILAALKGYREDHGLSFEILALARHRSLCSLALAMGADSAIDLLQHEPASLRAQFDLVFDTTGRPDGFELALHLARRAVHLKSTHGLPTFGLNHLTDLVVDELALLPYAREHLRFHWPCERTGPSPPRLNPNVYASETVSETLVAEIEATGDHRVYRMPAREARQKLIQSPGFPQGSPLPRFDLAVVTSLAEVDTVIRPFPRDRDSLLRPRGAILLVSGGKDRSPISAALAERNLQVHSSRCGPFHKALALLADHPGPARIMENRMITHHFPLTRIAEAFTTAADSRESIKVMVKTG